MAEDISLEDLRALLRAAGLPADETTLRAILPDIAAIRDGLAQMRELPLGEIDPAHQFQLYPEDWR